MEHIIANNIVALRTKLGYSEDFVSKYLGISLDEYIAYESQKNIVPVNIIENLSILYNVDECDFYEEHIVCGQQDEIFAFRADNLSDKDIQSIAKFRTIIRNYIIISSEYDKNIS